MTRDVLTTNFGADHIRHTVRISGDPSPGEGQPGYMGLATLLMQVAGMPDLLRQEAQCPETVTLNYADGRWVMTSVNIVKRVRPEE